MDYVPGSTLSRTTAEQALEQGAGVCQDHAHVFISASRAMGVPARYVVGYLLSADETVTATHAWAEAHASDLGWVGFDPANRLCPTDRYVRLGAGFDAHDASPIRGHFVGQCTEALAADVRVTQFQVQQ
jgi:transglutaminase-like putative cysteine protease